MLSILSNEYSKLISCILSVDAGIRYKCLPVVSPVFCRKSSESISLSRGTCLPGVFGLTALLIGAFGLTSLLIGCFICWLCTISSSSCNHSSYSLSCTSAEILTVCCLLGLGCLYAGLALGTWGLWSLMGVDLYRVLSLGGDLEDFLLGLLSREGNSGGSSGLSVNISPKSCCASLSLFCMFSFPVFPLWDTLKVSWNIIQCK